MIAAMSADPIDHEPIAKSIAQRGSARMTLLDPVSCGTLVALYEDDRHFRKTVVMQRHNYGRGAYRYFGLF
jgi:hypothetical protein